MLTPPERITAIQEIASRLAQEDWPLIDLTLRQFSLPWSEQWGANKKSYIIEMVSEAPGETLAQLAAHLGYDIAYERSVVEPDFWEPGRTFSAFCKPPSRGEGLRNKVTIRTEAF